VLGKNLQSSFKKSIIEGLEHRMMNMEAEVAAFRPKGNHEHADLLNSPLHKLELEPKKTDVTWLKNGCQVTSIY
jgi:hypothetical protein